HDMVRPYFHADYKKKNDEALPIEFDVVYMLQRREGGPKIFAVVAGDEMGIYRRYGLVDEEGKPGRGFPLFSPGGVLPAVPRASGGEARRRRHRPPQAPFSAAVSPPRRASGKDRPCWAAPWR